MEAAHDRRIFAVSAINRETKDWTALFQVVERHRVQVGAGNHGKAGKRYRRYMFVDEHGTKVSGIVFESDIHFFEHKLLPFKRYKISKAGFIPAVSFFRVGDYPFTWVLDYKKLVEPVHEEVPPCLPFTHPVCAFKDFFTHADAESYFDVKAIVIHVFPRKQVSATSYKRELVVIDESKLPVIMTLWDEFGDVEGLQIASLFPAITIIIARNVKATTFHGLSLCTRKYSYLLINPPLSDSLSLRGWCHDNRDEIATLLKNQTYRDQSVLFPLPAESDVITVTEALSALPVRKTAWVVGKPKFNFTKHKLWRAVCQTCQSTLDIPMEWVFECSVCGETSGVELRSSVPIQLTEGENTLFVTLKSPDVELLTKVTPQHLRDSDEFGLGVEDELKEALEKLTVICFLGSKKKKADEAHTTDPVRYTSIKAYDAADVRIAGGLNSPSKKADVKDDGPSEKQFFTPTAEHLLKEIADDQVRGEHSQRTPSAKRNIDFVSASETFDDAGQTTQHESATPAVVVPLVAGEGDLGSPLKKNKDKLKPN